MKFTIDHRLMEGKMQKMTKKSLTETRKIVYLQTQFKSKK